MKKILLLLFLVLTLNAKTYTYQEYLQLKKNGFRGVELNTISEDFSSPKNKNNPFNNTQLYFIDISMTEGEKIVASDGKTFGDALSGVCLTESSGGLNKIGDDRYKSGKRKPITETSAGGWQMRLYTEKVVIRTYPKKFPKLYKKLTAQNRLKKEIKKHKKKLRKLSRLQSKKTGKIRKERRELKLQRKEYKRLLKQYSILQYKQSNKLKEELNTLNEEIELLTTKLNDDTNFKKTVELRRLIKILEQKVNSIDMRFINVLLYDHQTAARLAGHYLLKNYERALKLKLKNPWYRTISAYNGTFTNRPYFKRVLKNIRWIRRLIKKGYINV